MRAAVLALVVVGVLTGCDLNARQDPFADTPVGKFVLWAQPKQIHPMPRFADEVQLGLGDELLQTRARDDLADPSAWEIAKPGFRGATGPFSAYELLVKSRGDLTLNEGAHPRCASPPGAVPAGLESMRHQSIQPAKTDSCLEWFSVDLFVNEDGEIAAVTLDLWEP